MDAIQGRNLKVGLDENTGLTCKLADIQELNIFFNNVINCVNSAHALQKIVTSQPWLYISHAKTPLSKSDHTVSYFMIDFLSRLSNKHFLILTEWLSSKTGIWRRGTNDQISGDLHACLIALRARSAHAFKKSLDFATFIRNQLLIPGMIFLYTHKIKLWFQRWFYVYT